jgi:transposase
MSRSKNGEAISPARRTRASRRRLARFLKDAEKGGRLDEWMRGRAVLSYIEGRRVVDIAADVGKARSSVNRWLQWYESDGIDGLVTVKPPGAVPRLSETELSLLVKLVEDGPLASGYDSGVWTGPMIGNLIEKKFGVRYHNHHIPRLLHKLGFSVQRPRKRLARADKEKQAYWLNTRFPKIKKKPADAAVS